MREQFPWHLDPTEEELQRLWDEATFCFDANVLLNLYRVDKETTEDYFKIFRALGNRIFLPHEAANQFFQNRRGVIRTEQKSFSEAKKRIEDWVERRTGFDNLKSQLSGGDIGQIIEKEIESVFDEREGYEKAVEAVKDDLIERIEDLEGRFTPTGTVRASAKEDEILAGLMDIFEAKTGDELDGDLEDLKDEARERYESNQPPGYEDYDGEDELSRGECEDFLIWKQLIEFAEQEGEDVLFITGEKKGDWWEKSDDHKIVRPRHELVREFRRKTGQSFWMLLVKPMLNSAYERLGVEVRDKSVEQTDKISENKQSTYINIKKGDNDTSISTPILSEYDDLREKVARLEESIEDLKFIKDVVIEAGYKDLREDFTVWVFSTKEILKSSQKVSNAIGKPQVDKFTVRADLVIESIDKSQDSEVRAGLERLETYLKQLLEAVRGEAEAILASLPH